MGRRKSPPKSKARRSRTSTRLIWAGLIVFGFALPLAASSYLLQLKFQRLMAARLESGAQSSIALYARPWRLEIRRGNSSLAAESPSEFISSGYGPGREKRHQVSYSELPESLVLAVCAAEDERFFSHRGFDVPAMLRAALVNFRRGERVQGGSTLTQQFVKNYFLGPEKTYRRKLEEVYMSFQLESRLSKEEIFELYANEVYLGQSGTFAIHGFAQGARVFFGKPVSSLGLAESALLAGIIQAPNRNSPQRNPEPAKARRNHILKLMEEKGLVDREAAEIARREPIEVLPPQRLDVTDAPYFVDHVLEQLDEDSLSGLREPAPLKVITTVDSDLQRAAFEAVQKGIEEVERRLGRNRGSQQVQAALIAVDPVGGEILAMVGGRDYSHSQFNRATKARRQPGSTFKPFVLASALETSLQDSDQHPPYTLATQVLDEPYTVHFEDRDYAPGNFGHEYHGPVTLRQALVLSLNVPTVKVAEQVGFRQVALVSSRAGLGGVHSYPSLALGGFELSLLELAQAYQVFANGGVLVPLRAIHAFEQNGRRTQIPELGRQRVLEEGVSYLVTSALESVLIEGTGRGVRARGFTLPAAGKTGTSTDGWFVGYTPELLCAVWVGFDDSKSLDLTGAQAALPIWTHFMSSVQKLGFLSGATFSVPKSIVKVEIDPVTGLLASPRCPNVLEEVFLIGTEPTHYCSGDESRYELVETPGRPLEVRERPSRWRWIRRIFR